jgi:hypothetical protein
MSEQNQQSVIKLFNRLGNDQSEEESIHHLVSSGITFSKLQTEIASVFGYSDYAIFPYDSMDAKAKCIGGDIDDEESLS